MRVMWLNPIALLGLFAVAVPVLLHLLTHQQARHVQFPTLRFLRPTRLAAMRRRVVQNWLLLATRMLILAIAVAALAAPLFVSTARSQDWQRRVARAIVIAPSTRAGDLASLIETERRDSFTSEVFSPANCIADGLRDAAIWLQHQPPAAREVVVIGQLKRDAVGPADVSLVPIYAGLRFLPLHSNAPGRSVDLPFQEGNTTWLARVALGESSTRVVYERERLVEPRITVRAATEDQAAAAAALNAVMSRGVELDLANERRVTVVFDGGSTVDLNVESPPRQAWMQEALAALHDVSGGASGDLLIVEARRRASIPDAAHLLQRVVRTVFERDRRALEPSHISAETVARWSRPPRPYDGGLLQDEGDRRWLWGVVLALLALETVVRRSRSAIETTDVVEARVA